MKADVPSTWSPCVKTRDRGVVVPEKTVLALHELNDRTWARQQAGIRRYADIRGWRVAAVRCDAVAEEVAAAVCAVRPVGILSSLSCRFEADVFGRLPVSYFDCPVSAVAKGAPYLRHDAEFTAHLVARELFSMKCVSYAFVAAPRLAAGEMPYWSRTRERFFEKEVRRRGGTWAESYSPSSSLGDAAQRRELAAYLAALPKPCGIFAANDAVAVCVRQAAKRAGFRLPEDIALVGVDNDVRHCLRGRPTITSVAPDWEGGGYAAAAALGTLIDGRPIVGNGHMTFRPLGLFRRETTSHASIREDVRIMAAMELIRAKACSGLGVERVVAAVHSSRRFAEKLFREVTGSSILEEIRRVRFDAAKVLLSSTRCTLPQIARRIGYSSVPTFCREFKQLVGVSPTAWRQKERAVGGLGIRAQKDNCDML